MQHLATITVLAALVTQTIAGPLANAHVELSERQTASGCNYFAAPRCCVPTVCQCRDGKIYQLNQDSMDAGGHGCDPPWGLISNNNSQFPGYCCREGQAEQSMGITGDEALEYIKN